MRGSPYPLGIQRCDKTKPCPPGACGLKRGKASKQEPIHNFKANPLLKHTVAIAVVPPRVPRRSIENKDSPQAPKGLGKASCRRRPQPELSQKMSSAFQGREGGRAQPKHRDGKAQQEVKKPLKEVPDCRGPPAATFSFILQAVENQRGGVGEMM